MDRKGSSSKGSKGGVDRRAFLGMLGAAGVTIGLAGPVGPFALPAHAADDPAPGRAPHQPYLHGYNAASLKSWSPESDRYAKYFRSRVPLATRIAPFAATQADPELATGAQLMNLSYDYDNSFFTAYKYNDVFARRLLRFWQYTDLYGSWHGMPVDGSPTDEPEHGLINLPNPAYTDAAHRNGAKSLGCWFWPRSGEFADYLEQRADGGFPVADKLIEMAGYFGFDGYFINQEAETAPADAAKLMEMLKYLRAQAPEGFHVQWYDTIMVNGKLDYQNQLNDSNAPWIQDGKTPVNNSLFANYWMPDDAQVEKSVETAKKLGLDPYEAVFHGTENEKYGYNPPYDTRLVFPEGKPARTSWALFGSHFAWDRYPDRENPDAQPAVFQRERRYWSGPNEDPTRTGRTEYVPWPHEDDGKPRDADNHKKWDGVARYITERSVIGAFPFVTRFNTGHGRAFFLDGKRASDREWNNASIQDILPTWQFWTRSGGSGEPLPVDYDYTRAHDGGSSLRIAGELGPENPTTVRLFKTALRVTGGERLSVTFLTGHDGGDSGLDVGLILADDPERFVWLPAGRTARGWTTATLGLDAFAGRTVAAVGVRVAAAKRGQYALNIGELALLGGAAERPAAPAGFTVDAAHLAEGSGSAEVFLSWRFSAQGVWYYDLHRELSDGGLEAVGRIYDEVYYVKSLARSGGEPTTRLRLVAVAPDGTRSAPATAEVRWA
ncbi:endo-beta-N-acetylglucosaminidase [Streptomyces boluensis]|uniref:Twin-arginine translocation signal domain-containing protein n=1 Tax=Streptomyces boluensis TaxID=1775135 RepID=A0A964UUJ1_9ACTN|nr:twin-arginine translocation signal domain-containing protein [Streptomyces boluensis]NBE55631.1 twin-arginine translocation signal domain-containing protein [Streptomyces boluensis]